MSLPAVYRRAGRSLRGRLLLTLFPPLLVAATAGGLITYFIALYYVNDAYDQSLLDEMRGIARQVRVDAADGLTVDLPPAARRILEFDPSDRVFLRIVSAAGETVLGDAKLPLPRELPNRTSPVRYFDAAIDGEPVRAGALGVFDAGGKLVATVLIAETLRDRADLLRNLLLVVVTLQAIPVLVGVMLLWFSVRRNIEPFVRVADAVTRRGWSDLRPIDESGLPAEARPLTRAINDLMERLNATLSAQQRFISDAAHQLRTPLAGLIAQTDNVLHEQDIESVRPAMRQLQTTARRAARLVNQLLTLARADPGAGASRQFRRLDLAELVRQTCMEWVPEALERGTDLGFAGEKGSVPILGDELLLQEMLNNLIDNALRYGGNSGTVTVRLAKSPQIALSVEDEGPGIPESEISHVFERFYRVPGSAFGGSGLGLAIVREIAQAHGARVSADRVSPKGGTIFRVVFPQP